MWRKDQLLNLLLRLPHPVNSEITVNIDLQSTQGDFLVTNQSDTATIAVGSREGRLSVPTMAEVSPNTDGRITAEILEGKGYALSAAGAPRNAEIVVLDAFAGDFAFST